MIRKKTSGITLFAALATGLSSSCSIVAIGNKANIDKTKDEGEIRSVSSEVKAGSADIAKLLAFGIGSTALTTGAVLVVNDKFNKNSEINTVNQLSSKIKEQENAINRLTQTSRENLSPGEINYENKIRELEEVIAQLTLAAKAKINELENVKHSGEQTTTKQGTNPLAIVMYVCVCLAMVAILASILFVLYKLKSAGVLETIDLIDPLTKLVKKKFKIKDGVNGKGKKEFKLEEFEKNLDLAFEVLDVVKETLGIKENENKDKSEGKKFDLEKLKETLGIVKLVGPITELIKKTFEIKEDLSLERLKKILVTVKKILEDPKEYVCKEIKELYSKLNGIELKNIVSLEEFKNEYKSLLESNNVDTSKEIPSSGPVSKVLNKIKKNIKLDPVPDDKASKPKIGISDKFNEVPGSIGLNGKRVCLDPIFREDIAYKAVLKYLEKKKEKLENDNKECRKKINGIKETKSKVEFDNSAIKKANFLKRDENKDKYEKFLSEYEELHKKTSNEERKKVNDAINAAKKNNDETEAKKRFNGLIKEFNFHLEVIRKVQSKETFKESDTKGYDAEISKLDKEIEGNDKKISKIDILNNKLEKEKGRIIKIISNASLRDKNLALANEETLDSVFNKINNYIKKETADDDFDEIVKLVNDYANALKEGNLINLISEQKVGKEKLEETIIPTLELVKKVAIFLNEKRKNLNKNEIIDIGHQNTNLEVIIKNVTNLLEATEKTMKDLHVKEISYVSMGSSKAISLAGVAEVLKNNYNEISNTQ